MTCIGQLKAAVGARVPGFLKNPGKAEKTFEEEKKQLMFVCTIKVVH
jgi:hypothetical protein